MRICSTCGREWAAAMVRCPADGTVLAEAVGTVVLAPTGTGEAAVVVTVTDELAPGTIVGEYEIEKRLGAGGMGTVYGARHPLIGKRAAVKVLHAAMSVDGEAIARFVQEAQAVNRIGHANIVDIFAFGTLPDGRAYFVMEWLQGQTLEERIERGTLPIADLATIMLALVRALEAAHAAGVIHRDLKPENVFLVADDDAVRVKLLDFGIAKLSSAETSVSRTATGVTVGTPLYMSPEQARGIDIDARTDIYSLGVVGYAMACGKTPFEGEASGVEVMHAHLTKPPRPPRNLRPDLPQALEDLILGLLAKNADGRPPLGEVRRQLTSIATRSSPIAIPVETIESTRIAGDEVKSRRHRTGPLVAIALAVVIMGGAAGFVAVSRHSSGNARPAAVPPATKEAPANEPTRAPTPAPPSAEPSPPPEPPPPMRTFVDVTIEPAGASVSLDGRPVAADHGRVHVEVDPGRHAVSVHAAGYRPLEQNVDTIAGKPAALTLRLARLHTNPAPVRPVTDRDSVVDPFHRQQ